MATKKTKKSVTSAVQEVAGPLQVTDHAAEFCKHVKSLTDWLGKVFPNCSKVKGLRTDVQILLEKNRESTVVFITHWMNYMHPHMAILDMSQPVSAENYEKIVNTLATVPVVKDMDPKGKLTRSDFGEKRRVALIDSLRLITSAAKSFVTESPEGQQVGKLLRIANKFSMQFKPEELRAGNFQGLMLAMPELLRGEETLALLADIVANDDQFAQFMTFIEVYLSKGGERINIPDGFKGIIRSAIHEYTKCAIQVDFGGMITAVKPHLEPIMKAATNVYQQVEAVARKNGTSGLASLFSSFIGKLVTGGDDEDEVDEEQLSFLKMLKETKKAMEKERELSLGRT